MGGETIKIRVSEVLRDIREGMDDYRLMRKYRLSDKDLRLLFRMLVQGGFLKVFNAWHVARDMAANLSDGEIMQKYNLSSKGLRALYKELDRLFPFTEVRADAPSISKSVDLGGVAYEIASGSSKNQIIQKCALSDRQFRWACMYLVRKGSMTYQQICGLISCPREEVLLANPRSMERYVPHGVLNVYDAENPDVVGTVVDISTRGVGVSRIQAQVGDLRRLVIEQDQYGEFSSIDLEAICRWARPDEHPLGRAGFEIVYISSGSQCELKVLLDAIGKPVKAG
jgi:uncharacterized protein (DUF433 family)